MLNSLKGARWILFLALGVIGVGLLPMARSVGEGVLSDLQRALAWPGVAAAQRPARTLPPRSGDEARFPRSSFGFVFENERGLRIDSSAGLFTDDRIADPDTTIQLRLTAAKLDALYREALAIRLFDELMLDLAQKDAQAWVSSCGRDYLEVRAGTVSRQLSWVGNAQLEGRWADGTWATGRPAEDWKRLNAFVGHVFTMVHRHPEYRALPRRRGMYID